MNELSDAQLERLAILIEKLGEVQQVVGKIIIHGYESSDPGVAVAHRYRNLLERELGGVLCAIKLLSKNDIDYYLIHKWAEYKEDQIKPYLHHQ